MNDKLCVRCGKHERHPKTSYCFECRSKIDKACRERIKRLKKKIPNEKACSVCGEIKKASDFAKSSSKTTGLTSDCKICRNLKKKKYRQKQREKFKKTGVTIKTKVCCVCKEEKGSNEFYSKASEADHLRPECKKCSTELFAKNRENVGFRIAMSLRERLRQALGGKTKSKKTLEYLGCSIKEFKKHLECKFSSGMSWDNYGWDGWHIDHIKPISLFDLTKEAEIKKACHYTNLQPLWAEDNIKKGAKYNEQNI